MPRDPKVSEWMEALDEALTYRRDYGLEDSWAHLESLYYNTDESLSQGSSPNLVEGVGEALVSSLIVPQPYVSIEAGVGELVDSAPVLESLDNSLIEDLGLNEEVETAIHHAYLWGVGILKLGYDSEFGFDPELDVVNDDRIRVSGDPLGMSVTQYDSQGRLIEFGGSRGRPGYPWVRAVPPHDILVPWGPRNITDSPWIAHRVIRRVDDIKADAKYENHRDLNPSLSMQDFVTSYLRRNQSARVGDRLETPGGSTSHVGGEPEFVEMWEIHDRRTGKIFVVSPGHERYLRRVPNALQLDGLPFVSISLGLRSRTFWTTPTAYYLKDHQAELTDATRQAQKQRRSAVVQWLVSEGFLSEEEADKFTDADVGAIVTVSKQADREGFLQQVAPNLNQQYIYQEKDQIRRDANEVVGFDRNQLSQAFGGRTTATEALTIQQNSQQKLSRKDLKVRSLYLDTIRKINDIIFEFWKSPRTLPVLDARGEEHFVQFRGSDLKGPYRYTLGLSSEPDLPRSVRRQQAFALFQAFSQIPGADQAQLFQYLSNQINDPSVSRILPNANVPLQMQGVQGRGGSAAAGQPAGQAGGLPGLQRTT